MLKMYINDEEVVSNKDFTISEELLIASSTVLNNCYPKIWENDKNYVSRFYYPKDYSKCRIYNDNELLFVGIVKNSADISLKPTEPKYCSLQILDFKTLLSEGDLLDFVISNKTIEEAIEMVIEKVANYGFVKGNIQILGADNIIGAYSTLDKTPYDVFQYLAEISQSIWFTRTIDENTTAIDFYDPTLMPRKENLQYDAEYWENNGIKNVSFAYGTYDYRNKQVVLSDEVFSDIDTTDIIVADGYSKQFDTINKIAKLNYIKVNGSSKSFATNEDKELGADANFYYSPGSTTIESNEDDPVYSAGSIIEINYIALVKGRQIVNNQDEISRIAEQLNRNGVISRYETRNDVLSSEELNKIAQTYIRYKGTAEIILTVETFNNDLYNIGDVVFFEAPIEDLQLEYLVKKKSINIINTGNYKNIFYTYELSSSFNGENAINWFDNQRAKATGNLESGDYITRNIDNEATANIIFKNLNIVEVQAEGDNVLNSPLNSPLIK